MSWIDLVIRKAQEQGQFDNLPGKGKPLNLEDDSLTDPEWRLANRLLKNAGFAPDWIESDRDIRLTLEQARASLRRSHQWQAARLAALEGRRDLAAERERDLLGSERRRAEQEFSEALARINREIDALNLKVPALNLQRRRLDLQAELERARHEEAEA